MKIIKKRVFATLIDYFVFAFALEASRRIFFDFFADVEPFIFVLICSLFFLKDTIFRNASLGKKILGLSIFNTKWEKPSFHVLIKRAFLMSTVGYALWCKARMIDGDYISILDWERNKLKTVVVDRKLYKRIQTEASQMTGDYIQNMTELYNSYLAATYTT